jgi:hypothetical protein
MNQEAFERLKIKVRDLTQYQIPRLNFFLSFEGPIKLEEAGRLPVWDYFRGYLLI